MCCTAAEVLAAPNGTSSARTSRTANLLLSSSEMPQPRTISSSTLSDEEDSWEDASNEVKEAANLSCSPLADSAQSNQQQQQQQQSQQPADFAGKVASFTQLLLHSLMNKTRSTRPRTVRYMAYGVALHAPVPHSPTLKM